MLRDSRGDMKEIRELKHIYCNAAVALLRWQMSYESNSHDSAKQAVGGRPPRYAPVHLLPPVGAEVPRAAEQTAT